jgi:ElaA protein
MKTAEASEVEYQWYDFHELTGEELYALLRLRQEVFVVEQRCAYQDCDGLDQRAWHLLGWRRAEGKRELVAYLRVMAPQGSQEMAAIGRLLVRLDLRRKGEGKKLLRLALNRIEQFCPQAPSRISAQHYLMNFYQEFGFSPVSGVYDEDGIPHITMIRRSCPGL